MIFLASYSGSSEEELTAATALVGRLAELVEAIRATKSFELYAHRAAQEAAEFARLIPKGHQGDIAVIGWLAHMMSIYKRITGKEPRFSGHRPGHGRGKPSGRFLLFVQAAAVPLEINLSPSSARSRQRALRAAVRHRQE